MATYQGHRSRNAWNVSLWINNDENLNQLALHHIKTSPVLGTAARRMLRELQGQRTPDGAKYNFTCIYEAIKDLED